MDGQWTVNGGNRKRWIRGSVGSLFTKVGFFFFFFLHDDDVWASLEPSYPICQK
jgi:hypothetical protein